MTTSLLNNLLNSNVVGGGEGRGREGGGITGVLEQLDFTRQRIRELNESPDYRMLRALFVSDNLLTEINVAFIMGTPVLQIADFSCNKIGRVPEEIGHWKKMTMLKLDRNCLVEIPETIVQMTSLQVLGLSTNQIESLPSNLSTMTNLKSLALGQNPLPIHLVKIYSLIFPSYASTSQGLKGYTNLLESKTSIIINDESSSSNNNSPISFKHSSSSSSSPAVAIPTSKLPTQPLTLNVSPINSPHSDHVNSTFDTTKSLRLDLNNTNFIQFPFESMESILSMTKLHRLNLGNNHHINFSKCDWSTFKCLKVINLDHCQLSQFPFQILSITSLRRLNIKKNSINLIPGDISKLIKLKRLDISHNLIDYVPKELSSLACLKSINMGHNKFKLNHGLENLNNNPSLTKINLNNNHLKEFPNTLLSLPQLSNLILDHNDITSLPNDIKLLCNNLKEFSIENNKLKSPFILSPVLSPIMSMSNPTSPAITSNPTSPLSLSKKPPKPLPVVPGRQKPRIPPLKLKNSEQGLGARVRSFTSYEYSASEISPSFSETQLHRTISNSSSEGGWLEDGDESISPDQKPGSRITSPNGQPTTDRQPKSSRLNKFKIDFIQKAKHSIDQISRSTLKKDKDKDKEKDKHGVTPRTPTTNTNILTNNGGVGEGSPSTPRPSFPERNGSNNSFKDSLDSLKKDSGLGHSGDSIVMDHEGPGYLQKARTYSESNIEYLSQSVPVTSSLLSDSMGMTEPQMIKSPPIESLTMKPPKFEFVEDIYDEKNMPVSFWKKRLSGLVSNNFNKSQNSLLIPSNIGPAKNKQQKDQPKEQPKLKKKNSSDGNGLVMSTSTSSSLNEGLKESTSMSSLAYLDGDDFIRDLMASYVINHDIEFTSEDGVPKIKTATLKMLISLLTHEKGQSKDLESCFFDTYTLFTSIDLVIGLLHDRFYTTGKNNSPLIKHRVLRFVQRWVDRNWEDFNSQHITKLLDFCKSCQETVEQGMTSTYSLKSHILTLTNIITMKRDGTYTNDDDMDVGWVEQPTPIPDFVLQDNFTLLDIKSHEIARQLTMIDHSLLVKITKKELLEYVQSQSSPLQSIANVTNRFNFVSRWVASEIVSCQTLEKRILLIFKFINISLNCWYLKNFNSATAILAGMKHGAVCRLKTTWYHVNNTKAFSVFQEFEEMISPTAISRFRKIMDSVEPPSVPYLGSYFNHLVGIAEGNKSVNSNDQINLSKYEMIGKILSRVHTFQAKKYNLTSVGVLQNFLNAGLQLTEDQLYEAVESKKEEKFLNNNSNFKSKIK